jgi:hypothetical protein
VLGSTRTCDLLIRTHPPLDGADNPARNRRSFSSPEVGIPRECGLFFEPSKELIGEVSVLFTTSLRTSRSAPDKTGVLGSSYNWAVARRMKRSARHSVSLPAVVFALCFILLGWIASHSIAYTLADLIPQGHHYQHGEEHIHGYLGVLKLAGCGGLVLAFALALRVFFRHGSFGEWLGDGGVAGTRKQIALATILPATVFVLIEYLERLAMGTGTTPSARLLVVGVLVQLVVGLLCLAFVRVTLRVAERVIRSMSRRRLARPSRQFTGPTFVGVLFVRSLCPMADSAAGRAPPFYYRF